MHNRPSSPNRSMSSTRSESSVTGFDTSGYESDQETSGPSLRFPSTSRPIPACQSRIAGVDTTKNINFVFLSTPQAGQTSILRSLAKEPVQLSSKPTIGFDMNVIKLHGRNICLWDIPFSECFSSSSSHIKLASPFHAVFFTATYYDSAKMCAQIPLWQRWLSIVNLHTMPKILLLTKCDQQWDISIENFRQLALREQFTAIIEVDWCNVHRLETIIKQLISKTFPTDRLSIYRYWGQELQFTLSGQLLLN